MTTDRVATGVAGLDTILRGGLLRGTSTLVVGAPGTGKTTLALQFMTAGRDRGERALFLSIAQSEVELRRIAESHGFDLDGVAVHSPEFDDVAERQSISVETDEAVLRTLLDTVEERLEAERPALFVFDSLLELRLLAASATIYRRELLRLRSRLRARGITALLLDHLSEGGERHAEGIMHGAIRLEAEVLPIGAADRRLSVVKMRGTAFDEGLHDLRIRTGGIEVYPRVVPETAEPGAIARAIAPGAPELGRLLGGGLELGTTLLIAGQSGTGKSTLAAMIAKGGVAEGLKAGLYLFEERPEVFRLRSTGVGLDLAEAEGSGALRIAHFEPGQVSPGEFSRTVVDAVERDGLRLVVIDSMSGYLEALPDRANLFTHLHALVHYLSRRGVLVVLTLAQHGLLGEAPRTDIDASYIADTVILLRQYAAGADIRRSVAVVKKRHCEHERRIQELVIAPGRVAVEPLSEAMAGRVRDADRMGEG
jgi:circadian clock protein KaiC